MKIRTLLLPLIASTALIACGGSGGDHASSSDDLRDVSGKVMTVNGPVAPEKLGVTLPHEHIFINFTPLDHIVPEPTDVDVLTEERNPGGLTYYPDALEEINRYKDFGGGTIVDVSDFGLSRDPNALQKISTESGLHVVMGAGVYMRPFYPGDMDTVTVDELTNIIVNDIQVGAQGTNVRAGIIGEIGLGDFTTPDKLIDNEIKSVTASARAARLTGAPMSFHTFVTNRAANEVLDMVEKEGVDLNHVIMSHVGGAFSIDQLVKLIDRGVYVERDFLAQAPDSPMGGGGTLDEQAQSVADWVVALADKGDKYTKRILLSHDICLQGQLYMNGGGGFAFILEKVVPLLKGRVSQDVIDDIIINNPQRVLTFGQPQELL